MTIADIQTAPKGGKLAYTVKEAAQQLSLSERTVHRLLTTGDLTSKRVGRRVLIPAFALDQFLSGAK